MKTKKTFIFTLLLISFGFLLAGCKNKNAVSVAQNVSFSQAENEKKADKKFCIVSTIYPVYDWVENLTKNVPSVSNTLLVKNGRDMHSYQASAKDIIDISSSSLFIFVGGESDSWVYDVLDSHPEVQAVNLMNILGSRVKMEEIAEGMQKEEEDYGAAEGNAEVADEHIWLSLRNAEKICNELARILEKEDPSHLNLYRLNLVSYITKLSALDISYQNTVSFAKYNTLFFCDRFPFRYMTEDYNLKYYAAFAGCSAENNASFETMAFLSEKLKSLELNTVLVLEKSDRKLAKAVIKNAGKEGKAQILEMNSIQNVTGKDIKNGKDYLSAMKENLEVLKKALN